MKKITIMRKWNNPQIHITFNEVGVEIEMSLSDFLFALADEMAEPLIAEVSKDMGSPALLMTNTQLQKRMIAAIESEKTNKILVEAAERVITAAKMETSKVA